MRELWALLRAASEIAPDAWDMSAFDLPLGGRTLGSLSSCCEALAINIKLKSVGHKRPPDLRQDTAVPLFVLDAEGRPD